MRRNGRSGMVSDFRYAISLAYVPGHRGHSQQGVDHGHPLHLSPLWKSGEHDG